MHQPIDPDDDGFIMIATCENNMKEPPPAVIPLDDEMSEEDIENNPLWRVDNLDPDTSEAQSASAELIRLAVLKSYIPPESSERQSFERLVALSCRVFQVPIAHVGTMELGAECMFASRGLGAGKVFPRQKTFDAHTLLSKEDLMIVPDATKDPRFKDNGAVTGPPHIRFYAGAPLVSPEGYRLGTFSILDTKPRTGLTLAEKQNLMELAAMAVDEMVEQRESRNFEFRDPSQLIACTANDLIVPLAAAESSISSIKEDPNLQKSLTGHQKDVVETAAACSSVMNKICKKMVDTYNTDSSSTQASSTRQSGTAPATPTLNVADLVKNLHMVMEPYPKCVPLIITTDPSVPAKVLTDDLKVFRSAVNYLTNACEHTERGSVHMRIYTSADDGNSDAQKRLIFECEDTGRGIPVEKYPSLFRPSATPANKVSTSTERNETSDRSDVCCGLSRPSSEADFSVASVSGKYSVASTARMIQNVPNLGLGLYSVATHIKSLGGKYGFRPRGYAEDGTELRDAAGKQLSGSIFWFSIPLVTAVDDGGSENEKMTAASSYVESVANTTVNSHSYSNLKYEEDHRNLTAIPEASVENTGARQKRALIIEDSLVCRKPLARALTKLGFDVVQSVNGLEGLNELKNGLFDLVLCDFLMPVMDGLDCIQQYREFEQENRPWYSQLVVGMSAHAGDTEVERAKKVGMNEFRAKPVTMKVLNEILDSEFFRVSSEMLDDMLSDPSSRAPSPKAEESESAKPNHENVFLVAEHGSDLSRVAKSEIEKRGGKVVVVSDGETALKFLQMRNWDGVLMDDDLPGLPSSRCITTFRDWEKSHRVNRQKNIVQMSSCFIPSLLDRSSQMQLPPGFDGAMGKPLTTASVIAFLDKIQQSSTCGSEDIVSR